MNELIDYFKGLLFFGWGRLWLNLLPYATKNYYVNGYRFTKKGEFILRQIGYCGHPLNFWVWGNEKKPDWR